MEGAAFEAALVIEEFRKSGMNNVTSLTMNGGASKSPLWRSIVANVTGLDVKVSAESDSASLGAAILAASKGDTERLSALCKPAGENTVTSPDENREYYKKKFAAYLEWRATHD